MISTVVPSLSTTVNLIFRILLIPLSRPDFGLPSESGLNFFQSTELKIASQVQSLSVSHKLSLAISNRYLYAGIHRR